MGMPIAPFFGDKTEEELEKELIKIEKKMAKLDEARIELKIAIALIKNDSKG